MKDQFSSNKVFCFCLYGNFFILPSVLKEMLLDIEFFIDNYFFFEHFENVIPLLSVLLFLVRCWPLILFWFCTGYIIFLIFKIFLFLFGFQQFECDVSWLWLYLSYLGFSDHLFISSIFLQFILFFFLLSLWDTHMYAGIFNGVPHVSEALFIFLSFFILFLKFSDLH